MSSNFNGKVALVTGATSGIGRATAIAFGAAGASVAITGRREKEGLETVERINAAGGKGLFIKADAALEADAKRMVEETVAAFGRLDFAFNNAGVEQTMTPLTEQTEADYDRIMNTNVKGVWLSMKYEIPALLKTGGGSIINNASIAGVIGVAGIPIYIASKHAVIGLTKSVALEYAKQNIRVNAVNPGPIATELFENFRQANPDAVGQIIASVPQARIGTPDEIAHPVLWLCSEGASFITGQNINIDGGYTVQ